MKKLLLVFVSFHLWNTVMAQEKNHWSSHTDLAKITTDKAVTRTSFPKHIQII